MSKKSHARREHKVHEHHNSADIVTADQMTHDFNKKHKTLIWILAISLIIVLPLFFAAATLLRLF